MSGNLVGTKPACVLCELAVSCVSSVTKHDVGWLYACTWAVQVAVQASSGAACGREVRLSLFTVLAAIPRLPAAATRCASTLLPLLHPAAVPACVRSLHCPRLLAPGLHLITISGHCAAGNVHGAGASSLPQLGAMSLLGALHRAGALLLYRAQHTTQQALRAIDWPAGHDMPEAGGVEEAPAELAAGRPRPHSNLPPSSAASGRLTGADVYTRREQLRLLRFAAQDWFERSWQVSGELAGC